MLAFDLRLEGWTATDWSRFLGLFRAPTAGEAARSKKTGPAGGVLAVHDGVRLRKLLHTRAGRIDAADQPWPFPLEQLAARHQAAWALALRRGALETLMDRFGQRVQRGDDGVLQLLTGAHLFRDLINEGEIELWPRRFLVPPLSTHSVLSRTLRSVCPRGGVLLAGVFEGGELWTSVALRRDDDGINLILGPDELRPAMGRLSGDWRRDYRHLVAAVEERYGPVSTGLFTDVPTFRSLFHEGNPGAWARAVALRDVILSPISAAVALPLAIDALRGVFSTFRTVAERFDPINYLPPSFRALRSPSALARMPRGDGGLLGFLQLFPRLGKKP